MSYIYRELDLCLDTWKSSAQRRPLLLRGARQVGKSYLAREWAKRTFAEEHILEINLEEREDYRAIFEKDHNVERIATELQFITGKNIKQRDSFLFIDEIQSSPKALMSLRYFFERMPELHVLAAGSLIDFVLEEISYPVGRIDTLMVLPLTFAEYLGAVNKRHYWKSLQSHRTEDSIPLAAHNDLLLELKKFLRVGGMPEAVSLFAKSEDFLQASQVHKRLVESYRNDFAKYSKKADWDLLEGVFNKSAYLIGNCRVKYVRLDPETRSYRIKKALNLLLRANLIHLVYHTSSKHPPLDLERSPEIFKILGLDVGLVQHQLGFDWSTISPDLDLTSIATGALAEQFVGQELIASKSNSQMYIPHYWQRSKKGSEAEIDFLIVRDGAIVPLEIKSGHRGLLKSLSMYMEQFSSSIGYILSQRNIESYENKRWLPLYMAALL